MPLYVTPAFNVPAVVVMLMASPTIKHVFESDDFILALKEPPSVVELPVVYIAPILSAGENETPTVIEVAGTKVTDDPAQWALPGPVIVGVVEVAPPAWSWKAMANGWPEPGEFKRRVPDDDEKELALVTPTAQPATTRLPVSEATASVESEVPVVALLYEWLPTPRTPV